MKDINNPLIEIIDRWLKLEYNICNFVVSIVPADGLSLLGARSSAATVITKCESHVYMGLVF